MITVGPTFTPALAMMFICSIMRDSGEVLALDTVASEDEVGKSHTSKELMVESRESFMVPFLVFRCVYFLLVYISRH